METNTENTAAGNAILHPCETDKYSPTSLMHYHTSLALIERLVLNGLLTQSDYNKSCAALTKKYEFPPGSIFAEIA